MLCRKCGAETLRGVVFCETCTNSVMDLVRGGNITGTCVVCGEPSGDSLFCTKKCKTKLTVSFQQYVLYRWQWNDVKREYKQDDNSIDLIEKEARSKGITYGELMAQKHNIGRITKEEADRIRKGQKK